MLTRNASSIPRRGSWKLWAFAPAVLLAAGSWNGGSQALASPKPPPTPTTYRIIPLWESDVATQPAINNRNQVAFSVGTPSRAKFYDGSQVRDIGALGGPESAAFGINDLGQAVGFGTLPQNNLRAFVWSRKTGTIDLGALPPAPGLSVAVDINNAGQIVGSSQVSGQNHAILWSRKTGLYDLGALPGAVQTSANSINEAGQIAGTSGNQAFLWSRASGMVGLGARTSGYFVNARGQVAGTATNANGATVGWVWTPKLGGVIVGQGGDGTFPTGFNDQGLLIGVDTATGFNQGYTWTRETGFRFIGNFSGGLNSFPEAVNNRGQVVGSAPPTGAFIWTRTEGLVNLNTRIPDAPPGLVLIRGRAIADSGAIVAEATTGLVLLVPEAVCDVAPVIGTINASGAAAASRLLSLSAGFKDADLKETHKAIWSWGDGKQDTGIVSERNGAGSVSGQHTWHKPGVYTVRLTVTDSRGKSSSVTRSVTVSAPGT